MNIHSVSITPFNISNGSNFTNTTVADINTDICAAGTTCPAVSQIGEQKCSSVAPGKNVPGETCTNNTDCYSNICQSGTCQANDTCADTGSCETGKYCLLATDPTKNNSCVPQVEVGKMCLGTFDCVNNLVCLSGVCTAIFSKDDGTVVAPNTDPLVCKSYYIGSYGAPSQTKCSGFLYEGPAGNYTTSGSDRKCNYTVTAQNITEEHNTNPPCALDGTVNQYCFHPGTNSDLWTSQMNQIKDWLNGGALKKHSIRRNVGVSAELSSLSVKITQFPKLLNADKCTLKLYGAYASASFAKISVALLALFFFLF